MKTRYSLLLVGVYGLLTNRIARKEVFLGTSEIPPGGD